MTDAVVARLEAVAARLEAYAGRVGAGAAGSAAVAERKESAGVSAFDAFVAKEGKAFIDVARKFKETTPIAEFAEAGLKGVRDVLDAASQCKKPSPADFANFIKPVSKVLADAERFADKRNVAWFPHQKAFSEAINSLQWITVTAPKGVIEGQLEAADFYLIQILNAAKKLTGDDQANHRLFVSSLKALLTAMTGVAVANYKMGIEWNPKGIALSAFKPGAAAAAAPDAPDAPPAPDAPAAPEAPSAPASAPASGGGGGMAAVFGSINSAGDRSATEAFKLKKVEDKDKAKYNRDKPALAPKESAKPKATPAAAAAAPKVKREPRLALDKGTWFCENYEGKEVVVPDVQMKQNVYIIRCRDMTVSVPDKCKSIQVDSCTKCRIVFRAVVSTLEVVNSERVAVVAEEMVPAVAIDKSKGIQIILSAPCFNPVPPELVTSNISECNVVVPGDKAEDDPIEMPIPEQFTTKINMKAKGAKKLSTEPVSHGGG